MGRRVAVAPEPVEDVGDGSEELDFNVSDSRSWQETASNEVGEIVEGIMSHSMRELHEQVERTETVASRDFSVVWQACNQEPSNAGAAFKLEQQAKMLAQYTKIDEVAMVSRIRMEAEQNAPRKLTAKGEPKALTVEEKKDYYRSHPEVICIRKKLVMHESFAEYAERLAYSRSFRQKSLDTLMNAVRATGTGVTSGYSEDD